MAITSGLFNSKNGDRKYDARWFAQYFATFIGNGVFPNPSTGLQVVEGVNMSTVVKSGKGWINGYFIVNDSDYVLQHDIADGVLKRIDRVVMRLNYLTRQIEIVVKKGTSASNPVAPTLQRDTDAYELALADVLINNGATTITQANITDTRLNNSLCGIVHGTVDQVDTTTIFNQYQSWFNATKNNAELELQDFQTALENSMNQWMQQEQQDFETWFATLQDLLDENIAATLTAKVQALENNKANSTDLTQLEQTVTAHLDEDASTTTKGHVQLTNAVDSDSEVLGATAKAVKLAYEKAEQAFQTGNNVKSNTVNALLQVDNSLPITSSSPWVDIISQIGNISTGVKFATGTGTVRRNSAIFLNLDSSSTFNADALEVNGLDFTPTFVFAFIQVTTTTAGLRSYYSFASNRQLFSRVQTEYQASFGSSVNSNSYSEQLPFVYRLPGKLENAKRGHLDYGSFIIPFGINSGQQDKQAIWMAFG